MPRLVPLRGSDFTGLGIEVCGGLKEGIYVKKVMPQGPAFGIVNRGKLNDELRLDGCVTRGRSSTRHDVFDWFLFDFQAIKSPA